MFISIVYIVVDTLALTEHSPNMENTAIQLQIILQILRHGGIPTCLVGEFVLNHYNVPRVVHV